jgi:protein phosphatase
MRFVSCTDCGRRRKENEDALLVNETGGFAVLCDGMGGRSFGEVAARLAVENFSQAIQSGMPRHMERLERDEQAAAMVNLVDDWVRGVNERVHAFARENDQYRDMGTTLVCLVQMSHQILVAHVGDSRAYRLRDGKLQQMTEDHSVVAARVKDQLMTAAEARLSSERNIITQAIGTHEQVRPDVKVHASHAGDRWLLCSDGLHDMLQPDELEAIMRAGGPLEQLATKLVDAANAAGGRDNISVVLGEIGVA